MKIEIPKNFMGKPIKGAMAIVLARNEKEETQDSTLEEKLSGENVLVFSSENKVYVLNLDNTINEIASRDNSVWALCSHPRKYFVDAGVLK